LFSKLQRIRINQQIPYREVDLDIAVMADGLNVDWEKDSKLMSDIFRALQMRLFIIQILHMPHFQNI